MNCKKCGKEIREGEPYCSNCGTKAGASGTSITINIPAEEIKGKALEMKNNLASGVEELGQNRNMLFANIGLLLLSFAFGLTRVFSLSSDGIFGSVNYGLSIFGGGEFAFEGGTLALVVFILGYLLAIVSLMIPLLFKKAWKPVFFLPAKVVTILAVAWFFVCYLTGLSNTDSSGFGGVVKFAPTFTGWIFILVTLGEIYFAFRSALKFKVLNAQKK